MASSADSGSMATFVTVHSRSWRQQITWSELSGACGDLGTFVPLLLGLVRHIGLDLGTTLIATGIYNIITGLQFGIPMPVQPMKTIAAVALSEESLTLPELVSAGFSVSVIVFLLGITRTMELFNRVVPFSIVRGIQLGVGLRLAIRGLKMVFYEPESANWRDYGGPEGLVIGLFGLTAILLTTLPLRSPEQREQSETRMWFLQQTRNVIGALKPSAKPDIEMDSLEKSETPTESEQQESSTPHSGPTERSRRIPIALLLVVLGMVLVFAYSPSVIHTLQIGPSTPKMMAPSWREFKRGFWRAGLPQLPMTSLNSVLAVCKLSEELFPHRSANPSTVASSVGVMNMVGTWFGVMPCCHGAGGLAAQVKFGAISGMAPILLGVFKLFLGLLFGSSLFKILHKFSDPLLGSMLVFSGMELASSCRSEREIRDVTLMLITATGIFATNNTGIGFVVGAISYALICLCDFLQDVFS